MAKSSATIILRGFLGATPEQRQTKSGQTVTNLNLAIDQSFGDNDRTEWVRVVIWNQQQGDAAMNYLSKGDLIECHASTFRVSAWASQDGSIRGQLEVNARQIDYIITKRNPNEPPAQKDEQIPF
jgi:single-strand DNA-binding protein